MTDNEIVLALEKFRDRVYTTMLYYRLSSDERKAIHDVLYLIDRQKAEIESCNSKINELEIGLKAMRGSANSYKAEVEHFRDLTKKIEAEARKEFAEKLKATYLPKYRILLWSEIETYINKLLSEMESESNA